MHKQLCSQQCSRKGYEADVSNFNATCQKNKMQKHSGKRQRALTPPEELESGLATAVSIFHITGIISQVLLLQRVNSQ